MRESAWVTARPLQEYRASMDSQTSGRNRRPNISLLIRGICEKQEAHAISYLSKAKMVWRWVVHYKYFIKIVRDAFQLTEEVKHIQLPQA